MSQTTHIALRCANTGSVYFVPIGTYVMAAGRVLENEEFCKALGIEPQKLYTTFLHTTGEFAPSLTGMEVGGDPTNGVLEVVGRLDMVALALSNKVTSVALDKWMKMDCQQFGFKVDFRGTEEEHILGLYGEIPSDGQ